MARLGFGVAGALEETIIARLAEEAERRGFSTFWVNDTPAGDGLAAIKAAARATASMRLGVGVIPVDRRPVNEILGTISELGLPEDRLLLGIASGRARQGSLDLVEAAIEHPDGCSRRSSSPNRRGSPWNRNGHRRRSAAVEMSGPARQRAGKPGRAEPQAPLDPLHVFAAYHHGSGR